MTKNDFQVRDDGVYYLHARGRWHKASDRIDVICVETDEPHHRWRLRCKLWPRGSEPIEHVFGAEALFAAEGERIMQTLAYELLEVANWEKILEYLRICWPLGEPEVVDHGWRWDEDSEPAHGRFRARFERMNAATTRATLEPAIDSHRAPSDAVTVALKV